jgi:DNA-directed RNA polymerase subunit RPC12/RpoP
MKFVCAICGSQVNNDIVALNKKLFGRKTRQFLCLQCLSKELDTDIDELKKTISFYKDQGCSLFA